MLFLTSAIALLMLSLFYGLNGAIIWSTTVFDATVFDATVFNVMADRLMTPFLTPVGMVLMMSITLSGWVAWLWQRLHSQPSVLETLLSSSDALLRRYGRIIAATADSICLIDRHYVYQVVNPAYLHWHHKQRDDITGRTVGDLLGDEIFAAIKPDIDRCLEGQTIHYQSWCDHPDQERRFVDVTYVPYLETDQSVAGVVVSLRNLTPLKQAEQALQESELRFRSIFDQMYQFIGLLTPDGILVEANQTALEFGGLLPQNVIGRPFWEARWWRRCPATQEQLKQAIARAAKGEFVRYEVDVQGAQGQIITIDFSLRPVLNEAGQVVMLIPEGRDISDRKQAEHQLELQAVITRNMAEGICMIRAADGIFVYANPKFERMFGYEPGELDGQHVALINYSDETMSAQQVNQAITQQVTQYGAATYTIRNVKKDGTLLWCRATTSIFDHPDHGTVMVAVQQDITQAKEAEDKLKASLREKEVLLQEIHHRVKNNLQIIDGLLQMQARRTTNPNVVATLQDSQSRISSIALVHEKLYQSENLAEIDFSQYIPDLTLHLFESYDVNWQQVQMQTHIAHLSLDIETAIPCGLIINELVSNALKYAFPNGRSGMIQIDFYAEANDLVLDIRDDGIGLPSGFDTRTHKTLGITLVRNLVEQLEGKLTIDSYPGTTPGATFHITFPQRHEWNSNS